MELHLPSAADGASDEAPPFQLEVIVRRDGMELTNGSSVIAAVPNVAGEYDMETLADYVFSLKEEYPESNAASVLMEPDIAYDYLIQVMDVVRSREIASLAPAEEPQRLAMFDQISVGSAP